MSAQGESLVGGESLLHQLMEIWGYSEAANGTLRDAVKLYQKTYKVEIDAHCRQIHGRESNPDGNIGPATARVINGRFCSVSDFPDAAIEEARWPDQCVQDITVSWNFERFPGASKEETDTAWKSLSTYQDLFNLRMPLRPFNYPRTRIYASLKALPGSTLAWSYLANNSCGFRAQQAYDSTVSWSSKSLRIGTVRHEVGHALGMNHTSRDPNSVMYPSMRGQWKLNETDIKNMLARGYKRRTDSPPPDSPNGHVVTATVTVDGKVYELEEKNGNGNGGGGWWP